MKQIILAAFVAAAALTSCNNGAPKASLKTDVDTLSYEVGMAMAPSEAELSGYLAQAGSDSAYADEFLKGYIDGMKSAEDKKKMAYYMGVQQGLSTKMQMRQLEGQIFQGDSTKHISTKNYISGFASYAKNKTALKIGGKLIDKETAQKRIMDYMFGGKKQEAVAYMQKVAKQPGIKALGSGVYGKEIAKGTDQHVKATDSVIVKYEGRLANGQIFDASTNQPNGGQVTLSLKNVIKGWQVAIPQMGVGSTWEIYIPYELGYGEQGTGPIPPFATLVFKITLVGLAK